MHPIDTMRAQINVRTSDSSNPVRYSNSLYYLVKLPIRTRTRFRIHVRTDPLRAQKWLIYTFCCLNMILYELFSCFYYYLDSEFQKAIVRTFKSEGLRGFYRGYGTVCPIVECGSGCRGLYA